MLLFKQKVKNVHVSFKFILRDIVFYIESKKIVPIGTYIIYKQFIFIVCFQSNKIFDFKSNI